MKKTITVPTLTVRPTHQQFRRRHSGPSSSRQAATTHATMTVEAPSKTRNIAGGGPVKTEASRDRLAAAPLPPHRQNQRRHPEPIVATTTAVTRISNLRQMQLLRLVNAYFPNEAQLNRARLINTKQVGRWRHRHTGHRKPTAMFLSFSSLLYSCSCAVLNALTVFNG